MNNASNAEIKFDLTDVLKDADYYDQFRANVEEMYVETKYGKIHAFVAGKGNQIPIIAMHGDGTGLNYLNWLQCANAFA